MFDLIVIGGGISGLGVAREGARTGLRVALLEAKRCAEQTSDNSLRIIHGGFRYLQSLDLARMVRSLKDQKELLKEAPESVKPLQCMMPLTRVGLKSRVPVSCASLLYGLALKLSGSPLSIPRVLSSSDAEERVPTLRGKVPYGVLCWSDAVMTDPHGIRDLLVSQMRMLHTDVQEGTRVVRIGRVSDGFLVYTEDGKAIPGKKVVNTLGPWIRTVDLPEELVHFRPRWCKAFNVVLSRQIDPTYALGIEGRDRRLFFAVPRGTGTAIGTWYSSVNSLEEGSAVGEEELRAFLHSFNEAFQSSYTISDVESVDVGVLPMIKDSQRGPVLYGSDELFEKSGYVEVLSTKYTTFRSQGMAVLRALRAVSD